MEARYNFAVRTVLLTHAFSYFASGCVHRWYSDGGIGSVAGIAENKITEELVGIMKLDGIH